MKEILLRITAVDSEMFGRESMQPLDFDFSFWKVKLPQGFHHPDIDRESGLKAIGE